MLMLILEVLVMAVLVIYGLRIGGALGVGILSILGLFIMIFVFQVPIGKAPVVPVMIILAIGIAGGLLEASGGLDYLVHYAGKLIEKKPSAITFVSPLIIFGFVFGIGTANITLSLEPIIARTALRAGIRPERPLVACVTTANMALVCSPAASSAIVAFGFLNGYGGYTFGQYLMIVLPAALISTLALSIFMSFRGKPLDKDPVYQQRLAEGKIDDDMLHDKFADSEVPVFTRQQKLSVLAFLASVALILLFGTNESLLHKLTTPNVVNGKEVFMPATSTVQIFMFLAAAAIIFITKKSPAVIYKTQIFTAAVSAAIAVLGPGWLGATIFQSPDNALVLQESVGSLIAVAPWFIVIICGVVATFVMSQTAIISIIYPLALGLGVPPGFMAAMIQAVNVNYFIPAQPTLLFAEEIDPTGSTQKYRFWLPGVFSLLVSITVGMAMWKLVL
ncbi:C4-dicarboxylate ABC transporter [Pragia fontium]|uniref:C4-dicarboxylate ABC transporter n=1 Tax=Pragia fontium TaxID=82985 RepID=A0ABQ5LJ99_9GAMM|nr:anaerobic C4-dicarboxylate transporter family protein [Pragia fontium]GKX63703.1 C4-dicarboxylate ABC transporter [Pragia fontium]